MGKSRAPLLSPCSVQPRQRALRVPPRHIRPRKQALRPRTQSLRTGQVQRGWKGSSGLRFGLRDRDHLQAKGEAQHAFDALKASADAGYSQPKNLEDIAEWSSLRSNPRFATMVKQVHHNAAPCEDTPENHQFDFWVGDWDVVVAQGGPQQGTSHIFREMNGCVLWENWTSASSPYFGKSYNTYNPNLKRWEQYWVDNSAGISSFTAISKTAPWTDDVPQPNGTKLRRHLQLFNLSPDKVRQLSQGSTDGGKNLERRIRLHHNRHKPEVAATTSSQ